MFSGAYSSSSCSMSQNNAKMSVAERFCLGTDTAWRGRLLKPLVAFLVLPCSWNSVRCISIVIRTAEDVSDSGLRQLRFGFGLLLRKSEGQ